MKTNNIPIGQTASLYMAPALTALDIESEGLGSLTPFSKTKQFYLLIDFLLKVFFLSNLIRIFVALYGTIAL